MRPLSIVCFVHHYHDLPAVRTQVDVCTAHFFSINQPSGHLWSAGSRDMLDSHTKLLLTAGENITQIRQARSGDDKISRKTEFCLWTFFRRDCQRQVTIHRLDEQCYDNSFLHLPHHSPVCQIFAIGQQVGCWSNPPALFLRILQYTCFCENISDTISSNIISGNSIISASSVLTHHIDCGYSDQ